MKALSNRAKELLKRIKLDSSDSFTKFALALELWKLEYPANKIEVLFDSILQNDPNYSGLYYHYAKFLLEQGRLNEALSIYDKGIIVCKELGEEHALAELSSAKMNAELDF